MYPYFRLTRVLFQSKFKPKLDFHSEEFDTIKLSVWPQDIDPFLELNNGRYVTLLDLGRFAYGARVDIKEFLKKNHWSLTITGTYNEYRYRLRLFQKFELKTKIIGYDKDWFYFFQKVRVQWENSHVIRGQVCFHFQKRNRQTKEVIEAMGEVFDPTQLPKWISEVGGHQIFKK